MNIENTQSQGHTAVLNSPNQDANILSPAPPIFSVATIAATSAAATLAACSGDNTSVDGGSLGGISRDGTTQTITDVQAARFLLHAQNFATVEDIAYVVQNGYGPWFDLQMGLLAGDGSSPAGLDTSSWDWLKSQQYNKAAFQTNTTPVDHFMWRELLSSDCKRSLRRRIALALSEIFVVSANGIKLNARCFAMSAYWDMLVNSIDGNFRTLIENVTLNPAMGAYLNTLGNKRADPSTGKLPDENYAREVLQLFTIGTVKLDQTGSPILGRENGSVETYSQNTISELAKVFTGYELDMSVPEHNNITDPQYVKKPMVCNPALHSADMVDLSETFGITLTGDETASAALKATLDAVCAHPNIAPFFCKQMIQRLVTSNPTRAYVQRIVTVFNASNGSIKAVVKAILLDEQALAEDNLANRSFGKVREPMLRLAQWARTFKVTSNYYNAAQDSQASTCSGTSTAYCDGVSRNWLIPDLSSSIVGLGQSPLRSRSVFNFFRPNYQPPNPLLFTKNLVAPELQITNESSVIGYINLMEKIVRYGYIPGKGGIYGPKYPLSLGMNLVEDDLVGLISLYNLLLTANQMSALHLSQIQVAVAQIDPTFTKPMVDANGVVIGAIPIGKYKRIAATILLIMTSPEYIVQK